MTYRIGAYARLSFDRNGEELAVERQHDDNRALVQRRGWEIVRIYTDNDVSAFKKNVVRPDFEQMVRDLEAGVIDGIVAYDLDRLWRQPRDLERVIDLYENAYRPFATSQGDYDLSTTDGRTMARIMVAMANKASADTARRVKRKIQANAEMGRPHWSTRPFGWNMDGSLYEPEAAVLSQMVEWLLNGYSYREIASRLNAAGMLPRNGAEWINAQVKRMLANPRLAAIRVHDGVEYAGNWESLVSPVQWQAIQDTMAKRQRNMRGVPNNRRYLLTGLLKCGICNGYLSGMTKRDGKMQSLPEGRLRQTYQCTHCHKITVGAEPLHHLLKESVLFRLDTADLGELLDRSSTDARVSELLRERRALVARRSRLLDDYTDETLTKADYKHAVARVDVRLGAVDEELDAARVSRFNVALGAGETLRHAWESRPDGWRRELLEILVGAITVNPSSMKPYYTFENKRSRFDVERIQIVWKF